jgi:uncharacterized SAM-binding protein YcdF (DUF218 family)
MNKNANKTGFKHNPLDVISNFIFVKDELDESDIILIPGSDEENLMVEAVGLVKKGYSKLILPSGGPNKKIKNFSSEWDFLRNIAIKEGIDKEWVLKEDKAKNTFENAKFSWEIIKRKNLNIKSAILVTKGYHSRRALMTYQTVFPADFIFRVYPILDKSDISKNNWFYIEKKSNIVMTEMRKISEYFRIEIAKYFEKFS